MISSMRSDNVHSCVVGIDPGTRKCGIAVVNLDGRVLFQKTVCVANLITILEYTASAYPISLFAMGDGTGSEAISEYVRVVSSKFGIGFRIVSETNTTQEGFQLALSTVNSFSRMMLLLKMFIGVESSDKWAAVVIARRAFANSPDML